MNKTETEQILDYLKRIDASVNGLDERIGSTPGKPPLSDRVDSLCDRVDHIDDKIGDTTGKPPLSDRVDSLCDRVDQIDDKIGRTPGKPPLSDRVDTISNTVDALDSRVSEVQLGLATLSASTKAPFAKIDGQFAKVDVQFGKIDGQFAKVDAQFGKIDGQFAKVDARFNRVERKIDGLRDELVDHMERIHEELAGRIVDLETPPRGDTGGSVGAS